VWLPLATAEVAATTAAAAEVTACHHAAEHKQGLQNRLSPTIHYS